MNSIDKEITVGWIGTGLMGWPMFRNLLQSGLKGYVFNRSRYKAEEAINMGAVWCKTPCEVATKATVIFTMAGLPADVEEIYFGPDGIFKVVSDRHICVDMTTSSPGLALNIYKTARAKGAYALDAPVSGGTIGAEKGTLVIMAGGDRKIFEMLTPLFRLLGSTIVYMGGPSMGQHTKMCNQITIASTMIGVCESLVYAHKAGLDRKSMIAAISKGAAACWSIDNLAPRIVQGDLAPGFMVKHFVKDLCIALNEAENMGLELSGLQLAKNLYAKLLDEGMGEHGTQALIKALG